MIMMQQPADPFSDAEQLDTSGLMCPQPLLLARQRLSKMQTGQRLHVIATDPHSELDFAVFSQRTGHALPETRQSDQTWHFLLQKTDD